MRDRQWRWHRITLPHATNPVLGVMLAMVRQLAVDLLLTCFLAPQNWHDSAEGRGSLGAEHDRYDEVFVHTRAFTGMMLDSGMSC